jgi:hypothetical protein
MASQDSKIRNMAAPQDFELPKMAKLLPRPPRWPLPRFQDLQNGHPRFSCARNQPSRFAAGFFMHRMNTAGLFKMHRVSTAGLFKMHRVSPAGFFNNAWTPLFFCCCFGLGAALEENLDFDPLPTTPDFLLLAFCLRRCPKESMGCEFSPEMSLQQSLPA